MPGSLPSAGGTKENPNPAPVLSEHTPCPGPPVGEAFAGNYDVTRGMLQGG